MAKVNQRLSRAPGQRAKRKAWGFTVQVDGKQKRCYKAEWTRDDAEKALAALLLEVDQPSKAKAPTRGPSGRARNFAAAPTASAKYARTWAIPPVCTAGLPSAGFVSMPPA